AEKICSCCNKKLSLKGYHPLVYRTLFGKISIKSPKFYQCSCKSNKQISFSPLSKILKERISPELNYLQTNYALNFFLINYILILIVFLISMVLFCYINT
ncbi:hypothetical protein NF27_IK00050, partial [Candidatus Jidaibacter acanthamoeba]